jgi:outer membrane protein OmpA-like peptidoglycan-associated protein
MPLRPSFYLLFFSFLYIFLLPSQNVYAQRIQRGDVKFTPGDEVIFLDTMAHELLGEFPRKWDLIKGSAENVLFDDVPAIAMTSGRSLIKPLMKEKAYLPASFTIEFDCYFDEGKQNYQLEFNDYRPSGISIVEQGVDYDGRSLAKSSAKNGWRHVSISYNRGNLKVFLDDERLVNRPKIDIEPKNFRLAGATNKIKEDRFSFIRNIRVAKANLPLYERLITSGKLVFSNIEFEVNKATLKPNSLPIIDEISAMMVAHPELKFRIEGHTDSDGTPAANIILSDQRAKEVVMALVARNIARERLTYQGLGEDHPIADNGARDGKARNRRVEILLDE